MRKRNAKKYEVTFESSVAQAEYILNRTFSERTLKDYRRAQRFLEKQGGLTPQQYRDVCAYVDKKPLSDSRYRNLKAGYQLGLAERVSAAARSAKTLHEQGEHKAASASEAEALSIGRELAKQEPDYAHRRYRDKLGPAHPMPEPKEKPKKQGKRQYIGKLNKTEKEWQKRIFKELPSQHRFPVAIMNLTGCRPAELQKPVNMADLNGQLVVTLNGSKVNDVSGQKQRTMKFDPEKDEWARDMLQVVRNTGRRSVTWRMQTSGQALRESHSRAVTRALGAKWDGKVSLYSYRHVFSADLKASGYSAKEIALAMGHASDRSQAYYGMACQGGGGRGLAEVAASRDVKESSSSSVVQRMAEREAALGQPAVDLDAELFANLDGTEKEQEQDRGIDLDLW